MPQPVILHQYDFSPFSEKVLARLTIRGTQRGELFGIAPTGRALEAAVLDLFHVRGGRLAEHWSLLDNLGMLRQLGVTSI